METRLASERPNAAGTNTSWLHACETDADCSEPMQCLGGCDVAWSGEAFLVAWWDIDHEADPESSVLRGQRITEGW